jgi:hypothetical protein
MMIVTEMPRPSQGHVPTRRIRSMKAVEHHSTNTERAHDEPGMENVEKSDSDRAPSVSS